jgi:hypothetical protein
MEKKIYREGQQYLFFFEIEGQQYLIWGNKGREQLNKNKTTAENISFSGKSCFEPGISEELSLNYEIG